MAGVVKSTLASVAYVTLIRLIPKEQNIPKNYLISTYAEHALKGNQQIIEETPKEPTGLTNVTWPLWKCWGELTSFVDFFIDRPAITLAYLVEKTLRGDFSSAVRLAEQNVESLKNHHLLCEEELDKLKPIVQIMIEVRWLAGELNIKTSEQIEGHQAKIAALEAEVQEITEARKEIDLAKVREAAEKVADYIKTALNQPEFLEELESNEQRITRAQEKLSKVTKRFQKDKELYTKQLGELSALMAEYEELGGELEESLIDYKAAAERKIKESKTEKTSYDIQITVYGN